MANNVLGSAALILSTDSKDLDKGLDSAGKRIETFAAKTQRPDIKLPDLSGKINNNIFSSLQATALAVASNLYNTFAAAGTSVASLFTQPLGKSLQQFNNIAAGQLNNIAQKTKGIGGVAGAALGAALPVVGAVIQGIGMAGDLLETFRSKAQQIYADVGNMAKQANLLGIRPEQFQEVMAGARVDADTLTTALAHLQREVSGLAMGSRDAGRTFAQLGLAAEDFQGQNSADQFRLVAERMRQLPTEGDRARVAFQLFGRQAQELMPALRNGLDAGIERARELGLILSDETVASIQQVNRAWKDIDQIQKGIWTQFAGAAVPAFQAVAQAAQSLWQTIGPLFLQGAVIAKVYFNFLKAGWEELMAVVQPILARIRELFGGGSFDTQAFIEAIATVSAGMTQFYALVWNLTLQIAQALINNVVVPALNMAAQFIDAICTIAPPFVNIANIIFDVVNGLISGLLSCLVAPAVDLAAQFISAFRPWAPAMATIVNAIIGIAQGFLSNVVAPLIEGARSIANTVVSLLEAVEENDPTGLLGRNAGRAARAITSLSDGMTTAINGIRDAAARPITINAGQIERTIDGITTGLRNTANQIRATADGMEPWEINLEDVQGALDGVANRLRQAGLDATWVAEEMNNWMANPADIDAFFNRVVERARRAGQQVRQEVQGWFDPAMMQRAFDLQQRHGQDPLERFQREFQDLQQMLGTGMIDEDVFARAAEQAMATAERELNLNHPLQQASAMMFGSREAANTIYQAQFGTTTNNDPQERIARLQEAGNRFAARETVAIERLVAIAENNGFGLI